MPRAFHETAPAAHVGRGWAFPVRTTVQGGFSLSAGEQNLMESIRLLLQTRIGERVYRPEYGCRLAEMTFAPMNTDTLLLIRLHVQEALDRWEPRIVLEQVLAEPDLENGRVNIVILYQAKETHQRRSLVYPFYLMPPE
ncbi:MAG: GPW/gp25 family protein [Leptolyngbya sp.]|nr:GPW/gp25 family protein [Leptolyngbya sp.]